MILLLLFTTKGGVLIIPKHSSTVSSIYKNKLNNIKNVMIFKFNYSNFFYKNVLQRNVKNTLLVLAMCSFMKEHVTNCLRNLPNNHSYPRPSHFHCPNNENVSHPFSKQTSSYCTTTTYPKHLFHHIKSCSSWCYVINSIFVFLIYLISLIFTCFIH